MTLAYDIAVKLHPTGKPEKSGNGGWVSCCPIHGDTTPSMTIWDDGEGGINVHCQVCGKDKFAEIKDTIREMGLLPEWEPGERAPVIKKPKPKPEPPEQTKHHFIWEYASDKPADQEKVKKYLANRNITLDPIPQCLRWSYYKKRDEYMVVAAMATRDDDVVHGVQRIIIDTEDYTKLGKPKMLGAYDGACTGRGAWTDRTGDVTEIVIGEGVETILSAHQATGKNSVAAMSAIGVTNFIIPEETETIYILVDVDTMKEKISASMTGQRVSYAKAMEFEASRPGRKAFLVTPNDTCFTDNPTKQDFNDLLMDDPTGESIRSRFKLATQVEAIDWQPPVQDEEETEEAPENDIDAEQAMFDRFVFLASENKVIDTWGNDINDSKMVPQAFTISQAGELHYYTDENGKEKSMPMTKYWLMSDEKKVAHATLYAPGEDILFSDSNNRTYYNSYRLPYQLTPDIPTNELNERLQNWHKIMETVFHEHKAYIEDWFSFSIQQPDTRAGIMPVCISEVGLGKSLIMAIMNRVVGYHNFSNGKILDVTGLGRSGTQWGDWIFNKKISCIEEIVPEGETGLAYKILDAMKDIITNETLALNLKGGRNGTFSIYSNIIGFSNHRNCVKIPFGDRRLFVVDSSGQEFLSFDEYGEIWDWMKVAENIIAVYQYLRDREISDEFIPGQAKMTEAKQALQIDGRNPMQTAFDLVIEQFPCDLLTSGELQLAVSEALTYLEGPDAEELTGNLNRSNQYKAILRSCTTVIANQKRMRVRRLNGERLEPSLIRAIRNGQKWAKEKEDDIRVAMYVEIPAAWIKEDEEDNVPF